MCFEPSGPRGYAETLSRDELLDSRAAHTAVITAIGEINDQANRQPNDQARPVDPAKLVHHVAIENDAENRYQRNPRRTERPRLLGIGAAQDHDGDTHHYECQQCANVDHFSDVIDWRDATNDSGQQTDQNGIFVWCAELWMNRGKEFPRKQAIVSHRKQNAGLAQQHDQHDAGKSRESADRDYVRRRVQTAIQEGHGNGRFNINVLPANHAGQHAGNKDIQDRANEQRRHDADRQITLRILALLRGSGDSVETDIGEQYVRGSSADAGKTMGREIGPVVAPVIKINVMNAQTDHKQHHGNLDGHDSSVKARAFLDADHQNRGNHQRDNKSRKVKTNLITKNGRRIEQGMGLLGQLR